ESKVAMDEDTEHTIFSDLLLTSDLKGYVEKPNYYFNKENEEVNKALDNLMLTQGYRRFAWKELAEDPNTAYLSDPMFKKESLGTDISGVVKTLGDKIVPNAKVTLISTKIGVFESATADANGRFKFEGLVLTDSIKFAVQARTEKNGTKVEVVLDNVPEILVNKNKNIGDVSTNIPYTMKAYIDNSKKLDDLYEKTGQLNRVQKLREVNISARKAKPLVYAAQGPFRIPDGHSDFTYIIEKPELCANLATCLQGRLGGVVFRTFECSKYSIVQSYPTYRNIPMRTILDGRLITDCDELAEIYNYNVLDPIDIVKIDVVTTNLALGSMLGGSAVLIYTRRGFQRKQYIPSIANISPKGFDKAREFYTPRYDRPGGENTLPDYRSTIYWNANLKTYSTGKASFSYFNADGPGNYKVIVEGINAEGELGRQVYKYTVDGDGAPTIADIPKADMQTKFISTALDSLRKRLPVEKVYLHTDKPFYNIGDTLWFKGYVMKGSNLTTSKLSGLLYVELDDDSSEVVRRISVPIKNGVAYAQIPLISKIFHEGGYTLRAYTNWSQNFGEDYVFNKRFYLGLPTLNTWLVKASAEIKQVGEKDELDVDLLLRRTDNSIVGLRDVEVKIYEGSHWLYNEKLHTSLDGSLKFSKSLKEKIDGRDLRAEIKSLHSSDGNQVLQVPLNVKRVQKI
ncbi:MAG TPA: carboxypeptidase-like regulatory domain-containing protein, partial [Pedobacter sp.]